MKRILSLLLIAALGCSSLLFGDGQKELASKTPTWPTGTIKFIVPYGAGGGADITIRLITKYLEKELGQTIVVQNITGGSGTIGFTAIADAKPDGYTFGYGDCNMSNGKLLFQGVTYDNTSFSPVCMFASDPHIIIVSKKSGIKSIQQLIEKAKSAPGTITFGLGGAWSSHDFLRLKLESQAGIKFKRMVFQSGALAVTAVAGDNCDVGVPFVSEALAQIQAGNIVPLAISSDSRFELTPDIPTIKESGFNFEHTMWRAIVGPAGIPEDILVKMDAALNKVMNNPDYQVEVLKAGSFRNYMPYTLFKNYFNTSHEAYKKLITEAKQ
jgi:tripartite-type tricarboxylate transporter receptor subunit TctC